MCFQWMDCMTALRAKDPFKKTRILRDLIIINDTKIGSKRRSRLLDVLQYGLAPVLPIVYLVGHQRLIRSMDRLARKI